MPRRKPDAEFTKSQDNNTQFKSKMRHQKTRKKENLNSNLTQKKILAQYRHSAKQNVGAKQKRNRVTSRTSCTKTPFQFVYHSLKGSDKVR